MASIEKIAELRFEPPGPGSWEIYAVHFTRPSTLVWTGIHPEAFRRGVHDFIRFYGILLDTLEYRYINSFAYRAARPAAEADIPQRVERAQKVFQQKLWREQLRDWEETIKPASIKMHRELQSIDPEKRSEERRVGKEG